MQSIISSGNSSLSIAASILKFYKPDAELPTVEDFKPMDGAQISNIKKITQGGIYSMEMSAIKFYQEDKLQALEKLVACAKDGILDKNVPGGGLMTFINFVVSDLR